MTPENALHNDLRIVKELVYDKCGFRLTNLQLNAESVAYGACSFKLDGQTIEHRVSKITPAKTGQFVTIWRRNMEGITAPFDIFDDIDLVVITSRTGDNIGQFVFPTSVLAEKGIISQNGKDGKRGIRVYPPWDTVTNRQAEKTKSWQAEYFLTIKSDHSTDLDLTRKLFTKRK
ncbi:MepB family protein [Flavitalea sp. BT771]|uniref:MepB family protein n=1 Tax=Flavitalea sp. BT771 TaxID=3063329 RepID=UPI0026E30043|nr:MepB family protein [Flavitalea sp. BT771]MDO6430076.1 MepB family protein [Flavitalea sp. BT771]MDV6219785.1 MepB family protein [Flavitalea sp. BT771]